LVPKPVKAVEELPAFMPFPIFPEKAGAFLLQGFVLFFEELIKQCFKLK